MISETLFASNYASIWRSLTPAMEEFVRRWNMDGYEREWVPMPSVIGSERRGIINEAGFILFSKALGRKPSDDTSGLAAELPEAFRTAEAYVLGDPNVSSSGASQAEIREAVVIARRLLQFFTPHYTNPGVEVWPSFRGNGIISQCAGDVLVGKRRLYEVKSGDRSFRSVDYRQLATYSALFFAETGTLLETVSLLNPRTGIHVGIPFEIFAREVSGQSGVTFCQSLVEAFSARLVSE